MDNQQKHIFKISYDTKETKNHTIDAEKLGEAIVSMSKALKNANKVVNGEESELSLEVKAQEKGSFVVEFISYLNNAGVNPLSVIGFVGATGTASTVLGAIKQLKSRRIKLIETKNKNISTLTLSDDTTVDLPKDVAELVAIKDFRDNIDKVIKAPIEDVEDAKFIIKDQNDDEIYEVTEEEAKDYKKMAQSVIEEITETEERKEIYFTKVNFEGASGWQIRLPDDSLKAISMKDEAFLERVNKNKEEFSKTALFSVKIKTIKKHRHGTTPTYKLELLEVIRKRGE
ncbi:hypothetical protein JQC92_18290 [Shewanella sp. 202IG2-18]|uniref:hypothetical protein n=1 Tax=Parashewanella hymeniacidonis TaxID=2807618 RepID=UPI00195F7819|nr:hypothetical protein [Parashewanella hymeniacidonis]MBM7073960.1 hypothetical protein [Parashewanella hymeniacidonis]